MNSIFVRILMKFVFLAVVVVIYVRLVEGRTTFIPSRKITANPHDVGLNFEDIYFLTEDGVKLNGWLIKSSQSYRSAPTLIFCHGNAGNLSDRVYKLIALEQAGVNVFVFDYRGYGRSKGRPTEKGMYLDAMAAFDYLRTREDIAKDKLVAYGVSLGGAAAVDLAVNRPVAALIAESAFTSASDMCKKILPIIPTFLLSLKLDSVNKIKGIRIPKLIIHSPDDEIIPFAFGRKLYDVAPSPKRFLEISGDHNQGYEDSQRVFSHGIMNFLREHDLI